MIELEEKRLEALFAYSLMDTEAEKQYDAITRLACYICNTKMAVISLIDDKRLWLKSKVGVEFCELSKDVSFCKYTILQDSLLEIPDTLLDDRVKNNPLVASDDGIRFYAGVPLINAEGYVLGTICVFNDQPNKLDLKQKEALQFLADETMMHMETFKKNLKLKELLIKQMLVEQELQQLSLVASHVTNGVVINDAGNNILWVNKAFTTITGYDLEDVKGGKLSKIITGQQSDPQILEYAEHQVNKKSSFTIELLTYKKNQEPIWLSIVNSVILDDQGEMSRSIEIIKDITERKKSEYDLQVLSAALSKSEVGVLIRNDKEELLWLNKSAEKMLGWSLYELKGTAMDSRFVGELTDVEAYNKAKQDVIDHQAYEVELQVYTKDRTPIWLLIHSTPLRNSEGFIERHLLILMDISIRKKAEEELIRNREKAMQLSNAKETFISVMSHEIRTPINAVINMSRILLEENPAPAQIENLNILKFSSENLLKLVNDILDFTKIETGNMQLESAPVDLKKLARQTLHTLDFKHENKNVSLQLDIDNRIPEVLMADSTRLYQILMNLLSNALKFTEKGQVKLSLTLAGEDQHSVLVKFNVSDTGIGIAENKLQSIFEAYSQASPDTTRKYGGTGLGLTITQKLILLHQSAISVKSEPGRGSEFYFQISFARTAAETQIPAASTVFEPLMATVLVADDNQINLTLAKKILARWGVETDVATTGMEAYNMVMAKDYDLVLMDLHMPVMDGLEATKLIRKQPQEKYSTLPIIALTGSVFGLDLENLHQEGLTDHFLKPYTPDGLYNKIKPYLNQPENAVT